MYDMCNIVYLYIPVAHVAGRVGSVLFIHIPGISFTREHSGLCSMY